VVVIQYRLGLFGFLAGSGVKEGGGDLNVGLCEYTCCQYVLKTSIGVLTRGFIVLAVDQQFALQWVQEHVSFVSSSNGRPANPTLNSTLSRSPPSAARLLM
jgi:hypothetical protein